MRTTISRGTSPLLLANPDGLYDPSPNGYSHVATVTPGAGLVYIAGQGGEDEDGALPADFRLQVFGSELERVWSDRPKPACTLVPVPRLALDGMLFEVEAVAVLPG